MDNETLRPLLFWVGLVLIFIGLIAAWLFLIGPHFSIFGPGRRTKHGLVMIAVAIAGGVIASFFRPRTIAGTTSYNR